jgi:hypothetical protein
MKSEAETKLLADLKTQTTFQFVSCFEKPSTLTAWDYSICVLEVLPTQSPFAVTLKEGWGEPEDWGVWAIGEQSQADWVATAQKDYRLHLTLFPYCLEDKRQAITIRVNNEVIDNYHWQTCDQWDHELIIPKSMVKIGMNHIEFSYDFAALPENSGNDKRLLAVGFTALDLTPVSDQPE